MNRRPILALVIAVILALVAACAGDQTSPPDDLVWATGKITADSVGRDIADAWNRQHPHGPRVRVVALPQDADSQRALLALELNAGIGDLDVLDLDIPWIAEFAANGWLVDLDDLRAEVRRLALPGPAETGIWEGTMWAVPFSTDAGLLYYRTDLVPTPPRSWSELVNVGHRLASEHGIAPFVADGAPGEALVIQFLEYLRAAGGELVIEDSEVKFDEQAAVTALTFMRDCYRTGFYAPGFSTMTQEDARMTFQAGEAVFLRSWPYAYRLMNGQDPTSQVVGRVGIAALPDFAGGGKVAALGGHDLAINRFSDQVDEAREFIRFATMNRAVQLRLAERFSMAPALASAYQDMAADPLMSALVNEALPAGLARPGGPSWASVSQEIKQQVYSGYTGQVPPEEAVATMQRVLRATVGR